MREAGPLRVGAMIEGKFELRSAATARPSERVQVVCLPHAGGNPWLFRAWSRALPASVELLSIELPGRGTRMGERPFESVSEYVERALRTLQPHLQGPCIVFGHSLGAIVGFELARKLERAVGLAGLIVSGSRAPYCRREASGHATHALDDEAFIDCVRRYQGTPRAVLADPDLLGVVLPILRSDFRLLETYRFHEGPPLRCPIVAYGGLADPNVSHLELELWRVHTACDFRRDWLPGGHFFLLNESHGPFLKRLRHTISDLGGAPRPPSVSRGEAVDRRWP